MRLIYPIIVLAMLAGCGIKGPLSLPDGKAATARPPAPDSGQAAR